MKKSVLFLEVLMLIFVSGCDANIGDAGGDVVMEFIPVQCEDEPWVSWYLGGNIEFVSEPSEEQLVSAYYSSEYGLDLQNVRIVDYNDTVCQACNTCRKNYSYVADVAPSDVGTMMSLGWNEYP